MSITALRIVTPASDRPISLTEAKSHLRVTYNAEDAYIDSLIDAATAWAQTYLGRILVDTEVEMRFDRFPESGDAPELYGDPQGTWFYVRRGLGRKKEPHRRDKSILLPGGVVSAVNEIRYLDENAAPQTFTGPTSNTPGTDYQEDLTSDTKCYVYPNSSTGWPSVAPQAVNPVTINYNVGWAKRGDVPADIKHAIKFQLADMFTLRDSADGKGIKPLPNAMHLLDPYVIPEF